MGDGHALRLALAREGMDSAIADERWDEALVYARAVCSCNKVVYPPSWPVTCLSLARLAKLELYHGHFAAAAMVAEEALRGSPGANASPERLVWEDRPEVATELRQILAQAQSENVAQASSLVAEEAGTSAAKQLQSEKAKGSLAITGSKREEVIGSPEYLYSLD